ncbi:MAG: ABC transporter permease, partial [Acidimicrobiia bacterium]|nr:ABC transporter permease [Acidimicrobiia bacterium]
EYSIGMVGSGNQEIVDLAIEIENSGEDPEDETAFTVSSYESVAAAEAALSSEEIDAALVAGSEILLRSAAGASGDDLSDLLQYAASTLEIDRLVSTAGSNADVVDILAGEPLSLRTLEGVASEENQARTVIAYGGLMLMYIAVLSYGAWTLTGVTEEKSNRVVEVLLATVKPWQLLAGKVIGIGALGLAQFVFTAITALVTLRVAGTFDLPAFPTDSLVMLILWFLLGFAMYSLLFGAAGSLVSRMEDAQSASTPLTLVALVGFFMSFVVLDNPDGALAIAMTFVPFTAPFVVPVRFALESISMVALIGSVIVAIGFIIGATLLAGRVYAGGLLQFGSRLKWREALRSADI